MSKTPIPATPEYDSPSSLIEDQSANAIRLVRLAILALDAVIDGGIAREQDDHLAGARTLLKQVIGSLDQIEAAVGGIVDDEPSEVQR